MPPENELKYRVDFIYSDETSLEKDPAKFWKAEAKKQNGRVEDFVNKKKAMEQAVSQIVASGDSQDVKLQKIYARVQQIRNTSFEVQKTEQEQKRAKEKDVENVEDIWKRGYGNGVQLTWLFLALARAAGIDVPGSRPSGIVVEGPDRLTPAEIEDLRRHKKEVSAHARKRFASTRDGR